MNIVLLLFIVGFMLLLNTSVFQQVNLQPAVQPGGSLSYVSQNEKQYDVFDYHDFPSGEARLFLEHYDTQIDPTHLSDWTVSFVEEENESYYGLTLTSTKTILIYPTKAKDVDKIRHVLGHELGHAIDVSIMDYELREEWQNMRGIEDHPWWPESGERDFETGAGDWAESVAYVLTGGQQFGSRLAGEPTLEQQAFIRSILAG